MKNQMSVWVACAALLVSGAAFAQHGHGHGHGHGDASHGRQDDGDGRSDDDWGDRDGGDREYGEEHGHGRFEGMHDRGRHEGWYKRGGRVPVVYRTDRYYVSDWHREHLREPPRGYRWVRSDDGEFLMIAIATGIIVDIFAGE